jgi:hypothetical protein
MTISGEADEIVDIYWSMRRLARVLCTSEPALSGLTSIGNAEHSTIEVDSTTIFAT